MIPEGALVSRADHRSLVDCRMVNGEGAQRSRDLRAGVSNASLVTSRSEAPKPCPENLAGSVDKGRPERLVTFGSVPRLTPHDVIGPTGTAAGRGSVPDKRLSRRVATVLHATRLACCTVHRPRLLTSSRVYEPTRLSSLLLVVQTSTFHLQSPRVPDDCSQA
jgi:hypothetical protein